MQEMRCRKGNVGTHSMRMPGVGKGKDADRGRVKIGSEDIEEARLSRIVALSKGAGLLNSPLPVCLSPGYDLPCKKKLMTLKFLWL